MLFKLVKREGGDGGMLGYEWIEVLAIEPFAIREKTADWGDWCKNPIAVQYVCRTEQGLSQIMSAEIWAEVDEGNYYEEGGPVPPSLRACLYYKEPYAMYEDKHGARFALVGEEDDYFLLAGPDNEEGEVGIPKERFDTHLSKVDNGSDPELN